ncbi:hypothetical protein L1281_000976 [Neisseria sp. HSC-16F19]|nr:hypothetical protein [Neisseria sp. HSC-16F19]MCP2040393.1 hypothetical protein [Neisseria sp. HSC-16F19]
MKTIRTLAPLFLAAALAACSKDASQVAQQSDTGTQSAAAAAQTNPADVPTLRGMQIGVTTIEQMKSIYPGAIKATRGEASFGGKTLPLESGMMEMYLINIRNEVAEQSLTFDAESGVLQFQLISRTNGTVDDLVRELTGAGFSSPQDPQARAYFNEFIQLHTGLSESNKEELYRWFESINQAGGGTLRHNDLFAFVVPAAMNDDDGYNLVMIFNRAYKPEFDRKWERWQKMR